MEEEESLNVFLSWLCLLSCLETELSVSSCKYTEAERYECGKKKIPKQGKVLVAPGAAPERGALKGVMFSKRTLFNSLWEPQYKS